ncbi:uncharacterized protein LOC141590655 [Silene latifolia]|uniref:uncharacterized protein LOC141590655 n=1 Tax=Silene latifolia TaxID=37657 RepID=UPI003D783027
MEFLSKLIDDFCSTGDWTPFTIGKGVSAMEFSHLLFADDLLLFGRVDHKTLRTLEETLDLFHQASGLSVNKAKSTILFSPNADTNLTSLFCTSLDIKASNGLGSYLGFPLTSKRPSRNDVSFIVDKLYWKMTYFLSNLAARTLRAKYLSGISPTRFNRGSHIWGNLGKIWRFFTESSRWVVGNGGTVRFWSDVWATDAPLRNLVQAPLPLDEENLLVCERIVNNEWTSLYTKGVCASNKCPFCPSDNEDAFHALRNCVRARQVWDTFDIPTGFYNGTDWLSSNLECSKESPTSWNTIFSFGVWLIWKRRNAWVFQWRSIPFTDTCHMIKNQALQYTTTENLITLTLTHLLL